MVNPAPDSARRELAQLVPNPRGGNELIQLGGLRDPQTGTPKSFFVDHEHRSWIIEGLGEISADPLTEISTSDDPYLMFPTLVIKRRSGQHPGWAVLCAFAIELEALEFWMMFVCRRKALNQ